MKTLQGGCDAVEEEELGSGYKLGNNPHRIEGWIGFMNESPLTADKGDDLTPTGSDKL